MSTQATLIERLIKSIKKFVSSNLQAFWRNGLSDGGHSRENHSTVYMYVCVSKCMYMRLSSCQVRSKFTDTDRNHKFTIYLVVVFFSQASTKDFSDAGQCSDRLFSHGLRNEFIVFLCCSRHDELSDARIK